MASQSQLGEGVYTVRLTNGAGAIIAVVSVKRPDPTTNPAPSPPYGREYWDLVTAVGGGETNYATFDNSVLAGGGTKALYFTKVAAWTYAADAHPPLPSPDAPTPANGTTLRRWITFGVAMATYP